MVTCTVNGAGAENGGTLMLPPGELARGTPLRATATVPAVVFEVPPVVTVIEHVDVAVSVKFSGSVPPAAPNVVDGFTDP